MAVRLDLNDPIAVLLASLGALSRAGIRAAAYGGLALAAYGTPRETKDADLAIAGVPLGDIQAAFRAVGLEFVPAFERARFGGNLVSRLTLLPGDSATGLNTVDFVEPRSPRFATEVLARSISGTIRGTQIGVVSPEDFILLKLLSTRERDLEDAAAVMRALGDQLDRALLQREVSLLSADISDWDVVSRWSSVGETP